MSRPIITCTSCRMRLQSDRPLPPGVALHCPRCRTMFHAPDVEIAPAGSLFGPLFAVAVTLSLLLGGVIIVAALALTPPRPAESAVIPEDETPAAPTPPPASPVVPAPAPNPRVAQAEPLAKLEELVNDGA